MTRYFLLYRDGNRVHASDGTDLLVTGHFPKALRVGDDIYRIVDAEDTFMFWDELRNASDQTVGFLFYHPRSKTFLNSRMVTASENLTVTEYGEVQVWLSECPNPNVECVQGFESEVYQCDSDPLDCLFLMFDWSQHAVAFELQTGPQGQRVVAE